MPTPTCFVTKVPSSGRLSTTKVEVRANSALSMGCTYGPVLLINSLMKAP